jgi:hypothetical protein
VLTDIYEGDSQACWLAIGDKADAVNLRERRRNAHTLLLRNAPACCPVRSSAIGNPLKGPLYPCQRLSAVKSSTRPLSRTNSPRIISKAGPAGALSPRKLSTAVLARLIGRQRSSLIIATHRIGSYAEPNCLRDQGNTLVEKMIRFRRICAIETKSA